MKINKTYISIAVGAIGIVSSVASTILAIKQTPKAYDILQKRKQELNVEKLPVKEVVKSTWKVMLPVVLTEALAIGCGTANIIFNREANLALAQAGVAVGALGTKVNELKDDILKEQIKRDYPECDDVMQQEIKLYDGYLDTTIVTTVNRYINAKANLQNSLVTCGAAFYADFLNMLDPNLIENLSELDKTRVGLAGWNYEYLTDCYEAAYIDITLDEAQDGIYPINYNVEMLVDAATGETDPWHTTWDSSCFMEYKKECKALYDYQMAKE